LLITTLFSLTCKNGKGPSQLLDDHANSDTKNHLGPALPYHLEMPTSDFTLIRDLQEISGLTYSTKTDYLLAVNDEKGYIYCLNPTTAKVEDRIDFGKSNDYEGIAYHDGLIYVVQSNGNLTAVDEKAKKRKDKWKTKLSRKNDVEGLVYNPANMSLLLAAKGAGEINKKGGSEKSIFHYDLTKNKLDKTPLWSMNLQEDISPLLASENYELTNYQMSRIKEFSPSGIAIHPSTREIYILSSRGKLLITIDLSGQLTRVHFLQERKYAQPEGICFGPDQTLYISNEGRAGKARLYSFDPKI